NQENLVRENVTRQLADMKGDHSLLNKRPSMIQKEDSAKECTTQEDLLNSIIETSNIFEK
ncbi:12039_t:CDS:1, partial [Funneliformis geosporum]